MTVPDGPPPTCICARIKVGMTTTDQRNWNPDCPDHGVDSAWWKSPEQVEKREADSRRLRDLQMRARAARKAARPNA